MKTNNEKKFNYQTIVIKNSQNLNVESVDASSLILYSNPHSRGNTVQWMLNECAVDYTIQLIQFNNETKSDFFHSINPLGKVPALVHRGKIVTETVAICSYLAEYFPTKMLKPESNSPYLTDYYRWLFFTAGTLDSAIIAKLTNTLPSGLVAGMSSIGHFEDIQTVIKTALKSAKPYLCGDQFTGADVVFASYLLFATNVTHAIESSSLIDNYLHPIIQRPAYLQMMSFVNLHRSEFTPYAQSPSLQCE
ncbi:glutathione S-transferase family protein [Thorsellia kenyensis]|uniref:Glutathione S-transferase family protein n=1 Tax=Thorsellia kenyensis TaxID=1549888 RepID=A0ABV6C720_9GAMM